MLNIIYETYIYIYITLKKIENFNDFWKSRPKVKVSM